MVRVIDGLFSTDAKQNWEVNREKYDELNSRVAVNEIFILNAFPWGGVNTFKDLTNADICRESLEPLQDDIVRMVSFNPETSDTFKFLKSLSNHLTRRNPINDLQAFGRLAQWYSRFDLKFKLMEAVEESTLWQALDMLDLEYAGELFDAYYSAYPEKYKAFLETNKPKIVGLLKRRTNSLTICENQGILQIEYLPEIDSENLNLNDESVKRAQVISSFLPHYREYHVSAIYPPIPELDYFTDSIDSSRKRMPKKDIENTNEFKVHVNRIWIDSIMAKYESASVYGWQKQWYDIRTKSLDLVRVCTRYIEAVLGGKNTKVSRIAGELDSMRPDVLRLLSTDKAFPKKGDAISSTAGLEKLLRDLAEWSFSWRNFLQQFSWLLTGDGYEKNVVNVNIQDSRRKLGKMQQAYKLIMGKTFPYFSVKELAELETAEYNRLARTVDFFLSNLNHMGKIFNARLDVVKWWNKRERSRINSVKKILSQFGITTEFTFVPPTRTIETGNHLETAIGVQGLKFRQLNEQDLEVIIFGLSDLADLDIDFYHLVAIEGNYTESKEALRISKNFFEVVKKSIESNQDFFEFGMSKPCPCTIKKELLDVLPGIHLNENQDENAIKKSIGSILMQLWKLTELRNRLSKEENSENLWRCELEQDCKNILREQMKIIKKEANEDLSRKYQQMIDDVIINNKPFTSEDFQKYFLEL